MKAKAKKRWISLFITIFAMVMVLAFLCRGAWGVSADGASVNLFPNGGFEDATGGTWTNQGGTPILSTDEAHSGEKSLKVSEFWARLNLRGDAKSPEAIYTTLQSGVETGKLYRISMFTKSPADSTTTLGAGFTFTGQDANGSWTYPRVNLFGGMYCYAYNGDWTERSSVFGLVKDEATGTITVFVDGTTEATAILSFANLDFDLGSNNGGTWFDDIEMVESSYTTDVTITLKDGENFETGRTIIIKDSNGNPLQTQPQIVENEGVYTVKGLSFNTLKDSYKYSIEGVNGLPDGVITALNKNYQTLLSAYEATVTVEDETGDPITDATVKALAAGDEVAVTNNNDGTYTIANLYSAVDVTVSKEGLIDKTFQLSGESSTKTVVLNQEKTASIIQGNMVLNGNFEETLAAGTQEPGKWNAEGGGYIASTTNNQEDGKYSLELNGSAAYRIDVGSVKLDGSKYTFVFSAMSENAGNITLQMRSTVTTGEGWGYPTQTLVNAVNLNSTFAKAQATFSISHDEIAKVATFTINGVESVVENIATVAAIDFVFTASNGAFIDNVCCLPTYDIDFVVRDNDAEISEGLSFDIIGYDGNKWDVQPTYSEGKWHIQDACGVVQLTVKNGEKTYPMVVFDSNNTSATVESGFAFTVFLKDNNGAPVQGATVVARKGATDLFTMTDNGDGTYTYVEALGTFNVYVTLDGYVFPVERCKFIKSKRDDYGNNLSRR